MYCPKCGSELSTKNIDGHVRQYCPNCGFIFYENPLPVVAALCYRKKGELLLIKRGIPPHKGVWALPTGFLELNESVEEGLQRELREETAVSRKDILKMKLLDVIYQPSEMYKGVIVIGFSVRLRKNTKIIAGDDAADAAFYNLSEMPDNPFFSQQQLIAKFKGIR